MDVQKRLVASHPEARTEALQASNREHPRRKRRNDV